MRGGLVSIVSLMAPFFGMCSQKMIAVQCPQAGVVCQLCRMFILAPPLPIARPFSSVLSSCVNYLLSSLAPTNNPPSHLLPFSILSITSHHLFTCLPVLFFSSSQALFFSRPSNTPSPFLTKIDNTKRHIKHHYFTEPPNISIFWTVSQEQTLASV